MHSVTFFGVDLATASVSIALICLVVSATSLIHWRIVLAYARSELTAIIATLTLSFTLSMIGDNIGVVLTLALVTTVWSAAVLLSLGTRAYRRDHLNRGDAEFSESTVSMPGNVVVINVASRKPRSELLQGVVAAALSLHARSRSEREW